MKSGDTVRMIIAGMAYIANPDRWCRTGEGKQSVLQHGIFRPAIPGVGETATAYGKNLNGW